MRKAIFGSLLSVSEIISQSEDLRKFLVQSNFSGVINIMVMKLNQLIGICAKKPSWSAS
jgi:hypothetical protein